MGTYTVDDGALPGKHRVIVIAYHTIGTGAERPGLIPQTQLDPKFSDYHRSGLTQQVEPGENRVTIEVDYLAKESSSRDSL